jgi:hypothetical protein
VEGGTGGGVRFSVCNGVCGSAVDRVFVVCLCVGLSLHIKRENLLNVKRSVHSCAGFLITSCVCVL